MQSTPAAPGAIQNPEWLKTPNQKHRNLITPNENPENSKPLMVKNPETKTTKFKNPE